MVGLGEAPQLANRRIWPKTLILNPNHKECAVFERKKKKPNTPVLGKKENMIKGCVVRYP